MVTLTGFYMMEIYRLEIAEKTVAIPVFQKWLCRSSYKAKLQGVGLNPERRGKYVANTVTLYRLSRESPLLQNTFVSLSVSPISSTIPLWFPHDSLMFPL